jgi:16S rRNA processing protein RimM
MALVGRVTRPHGLRGEVIVTVDTDFPAERFRPGAELFVNRAGRVEALKLAGARFHGDRPIIAIAGVEDVDAARELSGLELRVPAERLLRLPPSTFYRHDLVGCRVETRTGEPVGLVTDVEGAPDASRLVVASGDDEILIPLALEICTAIDAAAKRIVIDPPEGLLDLNK